MDPALRAVRAYLRAHPEANAGHRVEDDRIVVGIARDHDEHERALRELAGDRVTVQPVARPVRDLIVLQRRLEDELGQHGIAIHSMSASPLDGVVRLDVDPQHHALVTERYGDAVRLV